MAPSNRLSNLTCKIELSGLEASNELQVNTVSQHATKTNAERPKPKCHHCKKPGHNRNQCGQLKTQKKQAEGTQKSFENNNSCANNSIPNKNNNKNNNKNGNRAERKPKTAYAPCETCGKS